ncbi:uncharacterized protein LOC119902824 [Micropterus salmoides]|uniref:uncharacterized protein LOC119902824 n=1 Tax=Micropterus salmoides TaxID=27706 RepID=UPI0018EE1423|nr:uncharacterized protein LOC119902824 [Micropterus salmoides]
MVRVYWVKMHSQGQNVECEEEEVQQRLMPKGLPHISLGRVRQSSFHVDHQRQQSGKASCSPEGVPAVRALQHLQHRLQKVPLQSKFLSQLDLHSDNLMRLFQNRGGQLGKRLQRIIAQMADCDDVDTGRECIIKGVCIYMGEDPENLVREYVAMDKDAINEALEDTVVGIFVLKEHASSDEPEDIGVVLEGMKVLQDLDTLALAVAMLFGQIYALNLSYPADLRYTFEVVQKIFMELDGSKLSNKALALKNRLFQ